MPNTKFLNGDKSYDSDEFRETWNVHKIKDWIPLRSNRIALRGYSKTSYKQYHKVETMLAKLKDWRRITAVIIFWINQ